jgi:hypothetical protein
VDLPSITIFLVLVVLQVGLAVVVAAMVKMVHLEWLELAINMMLMLDGFFYTTGND